MKLTQLGIFAALGHPADRWISVWDGMFIPMRMRDALRDVQVRGGDGALRPLVAEEQSVYTSFGHRERVNVPRLWLPYLLIGLLLAAELVVVGWVGERSRIANHVFRIEATVWTFAAGLLGLILLLAWTSTRHVFWYRNESLLLLNPLSLWLAALVPLAMWRQRWTRPAAILAVLIALLSAVALILKGVPGFTQNNVPLILIFLPPHFAIAFGLWRRARFLAE